MAVLAEPPGPNSSNTDNERLRPGVYPAAPVPEGFALPDEPPHPPFRIDWSLGLKGSYANSSRDGERWLTTLNPQFTATHQGRRTDLAIEGEAEIARPWEDGADIEVPLLRLGLSTTTALDSVTRVTADADFQRRKDLPGSLNREPFATTDPEVYEGAVRLGIDRQFGRFNVGLTGNAERTVYGPSRRTDTGLGDSGNVNFWETDAALRVGYRATPILEIFGEASAGRDAFDEASPTTGLRADATGSALRGGVTGSWNGIWTATASVGVGRHQFDEAVLGDVTTRLYDASITFTPDPTVNVTAALSSSIEPAGADNGGLARIEHIASARLGYTFNSRLRLRASADWGRAELVGTDETERQLGIGAGADYQLNRRTALSADYDYDRRDNSVSGTRDTHRVTVGVTLRR